jgi:N-acetylmuramoyl-L-alanine amidase
MQRTCEWAAALSVWLLPLAVLGAGPVPEAPGVAAEPGTEPLRAVRIWPAPDYTRVTLESGVPLKHSLLTLRNPDRLVLDIENVDLESVQREFADKLAPGDPYIANLRVGRFKPGVVRVVLDLKVEVKPQIFTLSPIEDYGDRLVLDLYPVDPVDPILALLKKPDLSVAKPGDEAHPQAKKEAPTAKGRAQGPEKGTPAAGMRRLVTIVIDAGHGGEDPGAHGRRGTYEKNVTLTIARKLKTLVDAEPGMRAVLTRDGDYFIPLEVRVEKAQRVKADLFVSIHADAFVKPHVRGSSVFALSEKGATSKAAQSLAKRENDADKIGGVNFRHKDPYLEMTITDLRLTAQISDSLKLARAVLGELGEVNMLHKGRVEQAGFAVLKAPEIPSILVETAFISNPDEERRLNDAGYQEKIARAILRGIRAYIAKHPPLSRSTVASLH